MSKLTWNNFIKKHNAKICFAAAVPASLPKTYKFDKNGMKLPTPFTLLSKWLSKNMSSDWAITKIPSGLYVAVSDNQDAQKIGKIIGLSGNTSKSPISNQTHQLLYMANNGMSYQTLATALGYSI